MLLYQEFAKLSNLIQPTTIDRLHSLKKSSNYKYRLQEANTAKNCLAKETLDNYKKG